ncbi:MAG: class I SAM-dependent methyltransferase [Magnetococcus sp. DMHC-1]|nr:class I SAM-dependent methyltransferase [Magnetococcales bacterium]
MTAINDYFLNKGGPLRFKNLILDKIQGLEIEFPLDKTFLEPHNPLTNILTVMFWITERQKPIFRYLDRKLPNSFLEIACGFGVSPWLLNHHIPNVVGLDKNPLAISTAKKLFPGVNYVCANALEYLRSQPDLHFDIIFDAYGPTHPKDTPELFAEVLKHCDYFIKLGCRPTRDYGFKGYLRGDYKVPGYHLSFNTTIHGQGMHGMAPGYLRHYLSWAYLRELIHCVNERKVYYIPF